MRLFSFCTYVCKIWNNDLTEYQVWYKLTELLKAFRHFLTANRKKRRSKEYLFIVLAVKESFERFSCLVVHSLQCRRFLWALNLLAKATCWNFPKRGGDRASQRERGGGVEREEKTPPENTVKMRNTPWLGADHLTLEGGGGWFLVIKNFFFQQYGGQDIFSLFFP